MSRISLGRAALLVAGVLGALALYSPAAYASGPPIVTVGEAGNLTLNTATLNGTVDSNGASTTYKFEYGKSKLYGKSTTVRTINSGSSPVSEVLVGLEPLTTYHFRVSATNSFGTTVSEDVEFEMLLQWKVEGKPLYELPWAEKYPAEYRGVEGPLSTFDVTGTSGTATVEISCEETYASNPPGVLAGEYRIHLGGCSTKLNGSTAKRCKPEDTELVFNAFFVISGNQALQLGRYCALGPEIDLTGAGFGVGAMEERERPRVSASATLPAIPTLTMTYSAEWFLVGADSGLPFGVS